MQRLRDCLDVVEIVIGFLSSDRRGASTTLRTYIQRVLQMEKQCTSEKVNNKIRNLIYIMLIGIGILYSWPYFVIMANTFCGNC